MLNGPTPPPLEPRIGIDLDGDGEDDIIIVPTNGYSTYVKPAVVAAWAKKTLIPIVTAVISAIVGYLTLVK